MHTCTCLLLLLSSIEHRNPHLPKVIRTVVSIVKVRRTYLGPLSSWDSKHNAKGFRGRVPRDYESRYLELHSNDNDGEVTRGVWTKLSLREKERKKER